MKLEIDIPSMEKPELTAVETLRLTPIGVGRDAIRLNSKGPIIREINVVSGMRAACQFTMEAPYVFVELPRVVELGETVELEIKYELDFSKNRGEGLTWSKPRPNDKSKTRQFAQIHSQGQADENSRWFVCHDFPNERLTTELIVRVEDSYEVVSNGELVSRNSSGGYTTWHWSQASPHPNYLVSLVIGKFSVIEVGGASSARPGLPMPVLVEEGREEAAKRVFENTPAMVTLFERLFDEPYPWVKYSQACVRDFAAGGMENTSATTLYDSVPEDVDSDQDDLIAHELAHQWFGNLLTCDGWEHLWLNEGWASFAESLWREEQARAKGEDPNKAYQRSILKSIRQQRGMNRASAPGTPAMVTNRYTDPDKLFSRPDDVYSKGAVVLHMLRMRLGDDAFFAGVRNYIDDHKDVGLVDTSDFRRALEEASGQSLERFFEQWVMRPGLATLEVEIEYAQGDAKGGELTISITQVQTIDVHNPAYAMTLPVRMKFEDGTMQGGVIQMDTREVKAVFPVASKPTQVTVDPMVTVFARQTTIKPLSMWIEDLNDAPSEFALEFAREALAAQSERLLAAAIGESGGNRR